MKKRTIITALLAGILTVAMLLTLCACGSQSGSSSEGGSSQSQSAESKTESKEESQSASKADTGETRTFTDGQGRKVEIPTKIERICPLANAPRLLTYLGLADKFVGIQECEIADSPIMAYAYPHKEAWSKLPNTGTDSLGAGKWYAEVLIECKPDIIVTSYTPDIADDIQNKTGIPVVSFPNELVLFSDEYNEALKMLGDACGVSERADEVVSCIKNTLEDVKNRVKDVPDDNKPSVLGAGATFKGSHSIDGVYCNYPLFTTLAANDAATGISSKMGGQLVDREQILKWNPDIIFFDVGSMNMVNDDFKADPAYFNSLKAVTEGKLYKWPNSTWHYSNVEIPLVSLYYVGGLLYPEQFKDVDFEKKASEIFDTFLGEPDYLKTLNEAGAGYGPVTLGE